ncbi:MAG: DUF2023 family protein [Bacteroidota bacterium]|nr:DUF2023 family protein [Bacteroidota bacterium]
MQITCADYKTAEMQILLHHVYEYNKGLRNLVLHTMSANEQYKTEELLTRKGISYFLVAVNSRKINVFFGKEQCVKIIESFGEKSLSDFTDEEDFILGTMLGYERIQQCDRYMKRRSIGVKPVVIDRLVNRN